MTQKVDLHSRIRKHLGGEKFNLFVPECVVAELRSIGAPVELALDFALAHCEVVSTAQGARPNDAIKGLVGRTNPRRFFVATQEEDLRNFLRTLPGVPLLHLQRTVLLLETPASSSRKVSSQLYNLDI
jgi:U3 small nucleolar RNA-associated protein 23